MIRSYRDLKVYQKAFELMVEIYKITRKWPKEERYNLTDQILRSSRSVCSNIAEGWKRRRYKSVFVNHFDTANASVTETQVWLEVALSCDYIIKDKYDSLYERYDEVGRMLYGAIEAADQFCGGEQSAPC